MITESRLSRKARFPARPNLDQLGCKQAMAEHAHSTPTPIARRRARPVASGVTDRRDAGPSPVYTPRLVTDAVSANRLARMAEADRSTRLDRPACQKMFAETSKVGPVAPRLRPKHGPTIPTSVKAGDGGSGVTDRRDGAGPKLNVTPRLASDVVTYASAASIGLACPIAGALEVGTGNGAASKAHQPHRVSAGDGSFNKTIAPPHG
jgi:hypothetical protein